MATTATQTVKISQTILLDIDFAMIDSVRIVDVDLLILLKDGQRLIVPEGAVRALMDADFSINFKGRVFSVASLMELQTFKAQRITEVGIAGKPGLPTTTPQPASPDVQQLDLSPDNAARASAQARGTATPLAAGSPATPAASSVDSTALSEANRTAVPNTPDALSTEANTQARENASALDRQPVASANSALSVNGVGPLTQSAASTAASPESASGPVSSSLSPWWKYAVGALGAGVAALASRVDSKAAEAVLVTPVAASETRFSGVIALGPFKQAQLRMAVYGADASGKKVLMANTIVETDTSSKYTITLDGAYKYYAGPILVVMTDADPATNDFKSEATGAEVPLGQLSLRAAGYIQSSGSTTLNITPLTELAVRSALGSQADSEGILMPTRDAINTASTNVAQAFGLGKNISVTDASVKTVLDFGFNAADTSVATKYALALAALSGVDAQQSLAAHETAADQAARTLSTFAAHFVGVSPASAATPAALTPDLINQLFQGALVTQPSMQNLANDVSLNLPALLAQQIVETYARPGAGKLLALVGSSVTSLGRQGTWLKFHFDQPVNSFNLADVSLSQPGYNLTSLTKLDDKGMSWSALLQPPANGAVDQSQVRISFTSSSWVGNSWTWVVDTTPPSAPRALTLAPPDSLSESSDSGASATDGLSNVKRPVVRVTLNSQDSVAGDRLVLKQIGSADDRVILDGQQRARNDLTRVLNASDIGTGWVDFALNDLGNDGSYRLRVLQQDGAGNESTSLDLSYTLDTWSPGAVTLTNLSAPGVIDFGAQTPPGLVNARTKAAGILLQGAGGEHDCTISVAWGGKTVRQGVLVNPDGTWSVQLDATTVPADNRATQLVITQVDAAGNVSAQTPYTVEVNTAGVNARVMSVQVGDDSGAVGSGGYSTNAQTILASGQSTDDSSPPVVIKLDRPLAPDEVIQVYDGANTATPTLLFTLSGAPTNVNGSYVWTSSSDQWARLSPLSLGTHVLTARVLNTYTRDTSPELDSASLPTFVVQSFNFNQLLLNADPATNLIPATQSAGTVVLNNIAVNKPILGGTLAAALGQDERLGVYDTFQGRETFLGTATLVATATSTNQPTGAYTWRFACDTPLTNGDHRLSVRLETVRDNTTEVRLAMAQDLSVALPILSIAPAAVSPNGVSTDTGWSSTDNISSNRTPMFQLVFPTIGRRAGDTVTLTNINARDASNNPTVVYTYTLTANDVAQGVANFTTSSLLPLGANPSVSRTLGLMVGIQGTAANSPVIQSAEPLAYVLDTAPPAAPVIRLLNDTSYDATTQSAFYTTRVPTLVMDAYDVAENKLQIQWRRNGTSPQTSAWQDSTALPALLTDGTQDGTWTVFTRFMDVAGNVSAVSPVDKLGPGAGYFSFTLDTRAPATLSTPTLLLDSTNSAHASYASDRVTHDFHLRDAIPASLEVYTNPPTTARLEYRVWLDGRATPVQWFGSYLDALGAANNLTGDALTAWKQLDDNADRTDMTAMLSEGLYHVQRRQTDLAGNVSHESLDWTFTLDYQSSPLSVALANDTSTNQRITRDVSVVLKRQGVPLAADADPGSRWTYELTGYTDANHTRSNGVLTSTSTYTPPSMDGYYTLRVTQTNKADVTSEGVLEFQRDTTAPDRPGAISLWDGTDTHRGDAPDNTGVGDNVSSGRTPTFIVRLPQSSTADRASQAGDRLELYLQDTSAAGTNQMLWGRRVLTQTDVDNPAREVRIIANPLTADQTYIFKAQWVDKAGNASDWGSSVTYQLDTQALAPTIDDLQLPGVPRNFINHQSSVRFTGTGEAGSLLTLRWGGREHMVDVTPGGSWALTVDRAHFDADTARLAFDSTVTVSQVDIAGNASPTANLQVAVNASAEPITAVIDHVSGAHATGLIAPGQSTDERLPLLSGHLSEPLPAAQRADGSDQPVVRVYDGAQLLGVAQVQGSQWAYQVLNALTDGLHTFRVDVYDPLTLQTGPASAAVSLNSNTVMLDVRDTVNPLNWLITDTSTPTLTGTLKAPLASNEMLAVYDRQADGSFRKLGTVDASAIFPSTNDVMGWSYDIPVAMFGDHVYRVQVETTEGTALMTLDQAVQYDFNSLTLDPASDTGQSNEDNISRVTSPTVLIYLATDTQPGALVRLKVNNSFVTGANYQHTVSEQDLAARQFSMTFPDLSSQIGSNGQLTGDATYTLSATVGGSQIVSDLLYQLDTTRPTHAPLVSFNHPTGGDTGFTSDARLRVALPPSTVKGAGDLEEVQVVDAQGTEVLAWTSVEAFNQGMRADGSRFTLSDGVYTLRTRASDLAGNSGSQSGNDLTLRLDTQAAQVTSITPWSSSAAATALQQDVRLNRSETDAAAQLQFKLSFSESVTGLTLDNLRLEVSGTALTRPTLDRVTPLQPANDYASDWLVTVTDLHHLTHGETLKLGVINGEGVLDQALNQNNDLSYTVGPALTTDLEAMLAITSVMSGGQSLRSSPSASSVIFNGATLLNGAQLSGTTTNVEPGQGVLVSLVDDDGVAVYTLSPVQVGQEGQWSAELSQADAEAGAGLGLLVDRSLYTLRATAQDMSGNPAQASLQVQTVLSATIEINRVVANNAATTEVLNFVSDTPDLYVAAVDQSSGQVGVPSVAGFTVSGVTTIEAGANRVRVQLVRDGIALVTNSGPVNADGTWTVRITGNQVRNLTEGDWQLVASGTDNAGNPASNPERSRWFTVDTQASVNLDPVSQDGRINVSEDGTTLTLGGGFDGIESSHQLVLSLRDTSPSGSVEVVWSDNTVDIVPTAVEGTSGTWRHEVPLSAWDDLLREGNLTRNAQGVASLLLTVTAVDTAGNVASHAAVLTLDRDVPDPPDVGPMLWQVVGDNAALQPATQWARATSLADTTRGIVLAQQTTAPDDNDIVLITVDVTGAELLTDQWRLGSVAWPVNTAVTATTLTLGNGPLAFSLTYTYDALQQRLWIQPASGTAFSPQQVQQVLTDLAWVNTASDQALAQSNRVFTLHYTDAYGNVSDARSVTFRVDTQAPVTLNQVAVTTAVTGTASDGTVVTNSLNGTNTALRFSATIGVGEATGGFAEFYVGTVKLGTSGTITATDSTVSLITESHGAVTSTPAELQNAIAAGGLVRVKLYDAVGNWLSADGPMLVRDVAPPSITQIGTDTPDGAYKAGSAIALRLLTDDDIASAASALDVTLNTGNADVPNPIVTLFRDANDARLFTGIYTVQPEDTSADLEVIQVAWSQQAGALMPQDAAGNPLNLDISALSPENTLAGSRDIQIDTTAPAAIDLVAGGVLNTASQLYYATTMAGLDIPLVGTVGPVADTDVTRVTLTVSGADRLNDVLTWGDVELSLNTTDRSGSTSVSGLSVNWAYTAGGVVTFTQPGGGAWASADIQTLESSLAFRTYLPAHRGPRTFAFTHGDPAGNSSVASTQTVLVDFRAPDAPDLDALSPGLQRTAATYYGVVDLGTNKGIAAQADASEEDIAQITLVVGGVVDNRDRLVLGALAQPLNPGSASSGTNLTINGVTGVDWSYSASKVLTLIRNGGGAFTAAQIRDIERGLSFNTTAGALSGARTFTLQNTDAAGNASATSTQTVDVDASAPQVNAVAIQGTTAAGVPKAILGVGDQVRVVLTMSEAVLVDTTLGRPTYNLVLDAGGTVSAIYVGGSGTHTLTLAYTIAPTNSDTAGGVTSAASPWNLNGAMLRDLAGNAGSLASMPAPAANTLKVDTAASSPVTNMMVLDTNLPASTGGSVKVLNSSLFQLSSARGVHFGYNNTSAVTIRYRQDDGSYLSFSLTDSTSYTGVAIIKTAADTAFSSSTLGQAGLFDFGIDGASGTGYSNNSSSTTQFRSSGDGIARMMWIFLQAKPGKLVDESRLSLTNTFYYWLPSGVSAGNPGASAVTYDAALAWGNAPPAVPGGATVNLGGGITSNTQIAVGGHIDSATNNSNGWVYQYQGLSRSTPTAESAVDTQVDNRMVFDFSASGGISKSTVLGSVTAGPGRLGVTDAATVLTLWRNQFTPASGATPTLAEMFGAASAYNASATQITTTGGEGYMVSFETVAGDLTKVSKVTIDLGATSVKSKLLGGRFTFGSTVLKLPTVWATEGGAQLNALPTFDITLPAGVDEGSIITLYDGTTSAGTLIGTKYLTAAEVNAGFASLAVSANTPFSNTTAGAVAHRLSAKVTDNAGNVATNDSFYTYLFQDQTGPTVRAVRVWGRDGAGVSKTAPLVAGDQVMVTLTWDEAPVVTGSPTYTLNIQGVPQLATHVSTIGKEMLLAYTVGATDSSVGVTASSTALSLGSGVTIQDSVGNAAHITTPVLTAIDSPVILANPRGQLTAAQVQVLPDSANRPQFTLTFEGTLAQVGDSLVVLDDGVPVGSRLLTSSDISAGPCTLSLQTDSSLVQGTHAFTFQYVDKTGATTTYQANGSAVTQVVTVGATAQSPALTLSGITVDNEGRYPTRMLSDWSTFQSTSDPDLVFNGTVDQAATVTVLATSLTTGVVQTVGSQSVLANQSFSINPTAFSLAPDVYLFKVQGQSATGQVQSVTTGPVGVWAGNTGADTFQGTAGHDRFNAGAGTNTLSTGSGQDIVYLGGYATLASNQGASNTTITDFQLGQDKIDLTGVLAAGSVNSSNLMQFVSQSVSGNDTTLTIDSNGNEAGGTVHAVILRNLTQVPLDSSVLNYIVL